MLCGKPIHKTVDRRGRPIPCLPTCEYHCGLSEGHSGGCVYKLLKERAGAGQ